MNRLRTLGLMLMAVFAISAIATSAAGAVVVEPNSTSTKATSKNFKLIAPNGLSIDCKEIIFEGKTSVGSNVIVATTVIMYKECTAFGVPATVTETCTGPAKDSVILNSTTSFTIVLGDDCKLVVKTSSCSVTAPGKQERKGTWANGNGTTISSTFELNKAPVTVTSTGGICGAGGTAFESGKYTVLPVSIKVK